MRTPVGITVPLRKFDPALTTMNVDVFITREFRVRRWVAMALIRLGVRVMGMSVSVTEHREGR